jgi:hypothetical protein
MSDDIFKSAAANVPGHGNIILLAMKKKKKKKNQLKR